MIWIIRNIYTSYSKQTSKEDLGLFLSGSGNSINLVKCAEKANKYKINTFCLTGFSGGKLKIFAKIIFMFQSMIWRY